MLPRPWQPPQQQSRLPTPALTWNLQAMRDLNPHETQSWISLIACSVDSLGVPLTPMTSVSTVPSSLSRSNQHISWSVSTTSRIDDIEHTSDLEASPRPADQSTLALRTLPSSFIDTHTGQSHPIHYPPAFQSPPESRALSSHRPTPQLFLTPMQSTANFVSEAEQCGAWHVTEAEGLFGRDELISNDDWDNEEEDTDDISNIESSTTPTVDENNPDPFCYELETIERLPSAGDVHPNCRVYIIYLLVLWMHTQFHLPFQACNTFLIVVRLAFEAAGVIIDPPMFMTLPTVVSHLEAKPTFQICPVCPKCLEPHPSTTSVNALCTKCEHPLFKPALESTDRIHTKNR